MINIIKITKQSGNRWNLQSCKQTESGSGYMKVRMSSPNTGFVQHVAQDSKLVIWWHLLKGQN